VGIIAKVPAIRRPRESRRKFIEIFWERRHLSSIHDASRAVGVSPVGQCFGAGYEKLVRVTRSKRSLRRAKFNHRLGGVDNVSRAMKRATTWRSPNWKKYCSFLPQRHKLGAISSACWHVWASWTLFRLERDPLFEHPSGLRAGIGRSLDRTAVGWRRPYRLDRL